MIRCLKLLVLFGLAVYSEVQGLSDCVTPDGKYGICININTCPALFEMLKNASNPDVRKFLRRSHCGYEGRSPKVCCPPETELTTDLDTINPPNCGVTIEDEKNKIVGGQPAKRGSHPWLTVFGFKARWGSSVMWGCAGTIITRRYIVTAAHCLFYNDPHWYVVRVGEHNLDDEGADGAKPVDFDVAKIIIHPNYSRNADYDDIALVELKQQITYDNYTKPICLPITPELRSNDFSANSPTVAGWGRLESFGSWSNRLMEVEVPVVGNKECNDSYVKENSTIIGSQICAGKVGKDSCRGDSGGPLILPRKENKYYLIGVVSFGSGCGVDNYPGVYTRVTSYVDWILDNVK